MEDERTIGTHSVQALEKVDNEVWRNFSTPHGPSVSGQTFRIKSFPIFGKEVAGNGCGAGYIK